MKEQESLSRLDTLEEKVGKLFEEAAALRARCQASEEMLSSTRDKLETTTASLAKLWEHVRQDYDSVAAKLSSVDMTLDAHSHCVNTIRPELNYFRYIVSRALLCADGPYNWRGTSYRPDVEFVAEAPKQGIQKPPEDFDAMFLR
jgi:hypothetical protein